MWLCERRWYKFFIFSSLLSFNALSPINPIECYAFASLRKQFSAVQKISDILPLPMARAGASDTVGIGCICVVDAHDNVYYIGNHKM